MHPSKSVLLSHQLCFFSLPAFFSSSPVKAMEVILMKSIMWDLQTVLEALQVIQMAPSPGGKSELL